MLLKATYGKKTLICFSKYVFKLFNDEQFVHTNYIYTLLYVCKYSILSEILFYKFCFYFKINRNYTYIMYFIENLIGRTHMITD